MARVPKVVGVKIRANEGLWVDCGERLRGKFNAVPPRSSPGRVSRAKRRSTSTAQLLRAFRDEDEAT